MERFSERTVLYVSVDGILDVLGQSQILTYLQGLTRYGWRFLLVTLEKVQSWSGCLALRQRLRAQGIMWFPLLYRGVPRWVNVPVEMGVLRDVLVALIRQFRPALIHVRGTHPGLSVLRALRQVGGPPPLLLYDMRQFWADQRRESQVWDVRRRPHHFYYYWRAKQVEKALLARARAVVVLTMRARRLLEFWYQTGWLERLGEVVVIPCGAPAESIPAGLDAWERARRQLGLAMDRRYVGVMGSGSPWYDWDATGEFLRLLTRMYSDVDVCLWLWGIRQEDVERWVRAWGLALERVMIGRFRWREVLSFVPALDAGVLFQGGRISALGTSPVKVSEWLLAGVPVIANALGDLPELLPRIQGIPVVAQTDVVGMRRWLVRWMPEVFRKRREESMEIRQRAMATFSAERIVERYHRVYTRLLG